jgi:hypothetical protein
VVTHDEVSEQLDAYVIGAVDAGEASEIELHLAECEECSQALVEAAEFAGLLALAAPLRTPGDMLHARLMDAVRGEAEQPLTARPSGLRRWVERLAPPAAAAAIAGVAVWAGLLQNQVQDLRSKSDDLSVQVARTRREAPDLQAVKAQAQQAMSISRATYKKVDDYQAVLNVVADPSVTHASMRAAEYAPGAIGDVYWDRQRQIFAFMFANLPEPPEGQAYQVWLWKDGQPTSGGTFTPTELGFAMQIVPATGSGLRDFDGIGVTLEVAAGAAAPSGPDVIQLPID